MSVFAALVSLCLSLARPVHAGEATGHVPLAALLEEVKQNNPEILAARKSWEAEQAMILSAKTWKDPMLGADLWRIPSGKGPTPGNARMDMYMVQQEIPFPGKLSARGKAQTHAARLAQRRYEGVVLGVSRKAAQAYYSLWHLDEAVKIHALHAKLWERFSRVAERQYAAGKVMQRDVLRAQVEADKVALQAANLEELRAPALTRLNALLNRAPDTALGALEPPRVRPLPKESLSLEHNADIRAMEHHETHRRFLTREARLGYLPDFTVGWTRMLEADGFSGYNAQLQLRIPLYFWKQRAEVKTAEAAGEQASAQLADTRNRVQFELKAAVAAERNAARTVEIYRGSILPRAEKALDVVESGYLSGKAGFLDLLDTERRLLLEKLEHLEAQARYGKALAELEETVGLPLSGE